ncbi:MAG: 5-(carboxyamino)imidazole ribonucleotide synthase, partial [Cyanobacteria bacterium K_DeepCast_35m_m2_023]|nr:5-(carboxyamino)imidazole ribonucleotide synthase [Cyanobacteria bacterium K_DeepCast_35m_m2_023]
MLVDSAVAVHGLEPADAIGVVGGGQLALMLAQAAPELGLALHVQTPNPSDPAAAAASSVVLAPLDDVFGTRQLAQRCAAISFENEWLDLDALAALEADGVRFVPQLAALEHLVSKRRQRELLDALHLPSPRWCGLERVFEQPHHDEDSAAEDGSAESAAEPEPETCNAVAPRLPDGFAFPLMAKAAT